MSLFSSFRKNKQESVADDHAFSPRSESAQTASPRSRRRKQSDRSDAPLDPVLPEKKRARRRLIGAVALVLAAIVGLPMILDSEPKPLADDIAIRIPSRDKPRLAATEEGAPAQSERSEIPANAALDPKEEVVESAAGSGTNTAANTNSTRAGAESASKKEVAKESVKASEPAPSENVAKGSSTSTQSVVNEARESGKNSEKAHDSARAKALLDGKNDPRQATEKKSGAFVIQVAALASKEKVGEVQAKLKDAGIKSYTQTIATDAGERIRIRVGPFDSKEDAEKVRAKLAKLGLNGSLVPT